MDTDVVFEGLSHQYRRELLRYLCEEESASLRTVAEHIAACEAGVSRDEVSDDQYERVLADLYHTHVPKLADIGVIEFDVHREQITPTSKVRDLCEYLELWE